MDLIELYGEVFGSTERQRLFERLSERHQKLLAPNPVSTTRPDFLFLDDVEELLKTLDDAVGGCSSARFETSVAETMTRSIARRAMSKNDSSLRECLNRIIPLVEDCWPIRPPTITVEELPTGLRVTMALLGYSRCTRLLAFQLLGAVKCACRLTNDSVPEEQHTTVDFFGDRARIDVYRRLSLRPNPSPTDQSFSRRPSQRSSRPVRPSLTEQVESILGRRAPSIPPTSPSKPSNSPPTNALGMALLRQPTQSEFPVTQPSSPKLPVSFTAPRMPRIDETRRNTPPYGRLLNVAPPLAPPSLPRIEPEQPAAPNTLIPPSRRSGPPK